MANFELNFYNSLIYAFIAENDDVRIIKLISMKNLYQQDVRLCQTLTITLDFRESL